jgi:hypothetical protein
MTAPLYPETSRPWDADSLYRNHHYRQLEQHYRQSAQYAAMVERYPLLRSSIAACQQIELICDASAELTDRETAIHLHWNRSHGEG